MITNDEFEQFIQNLKSEMSRQGITQMELSRRTGIAQANICHILQGTQKPRQGNIEKIAECLAVPVSDLLPNSNQPRQLLIAKSILDEMKYEIYKKIVVDGHQNVPDYERLQISLEVSQIIDRYFASNNTTVK